MNNRVKQGVVEEVNMVEVNLEEVTEEVETVVVTEVVSGVVEKDCTTHLKHFCY